MSKITGQNVVAFNLRAIGDLIKGTTDQKVGELADETLRLSLKEVPHDKGTLENTGNARRVAFAEHEVGYHTPYAHRLHEHPEYKFQKGRKGKFLTDPLMQVMKKAPSYIGAGIKERAL